MDGLWKLEAHVSIDIWSSEVFNHHPQAPSTLTLLRKYRVLGRLTILLGVVVMFAIYAFAPLEPEWGVIFSALAGFVSLTLVTHFKEKGRIVAERLWWEFCNLAERLGLRVEELGLMNLFEVQILAEKRIAEQAAEVLRWRNETASLQTRLGDDDTSIRIFLWRKVEIERKRRDFELSELIDAVDKFNLLGHTTEEEIRAKAFRSARALLRHEH